MTADELKAILDKHAKWLNDAEGGARADLSGANLSGANLRSADLSGANLRSANLRSAVGTAAVESMPDIRARTLAAVEAEGCKIVMQTWHSCETTHCLAGWITTIHPQGKLLESIFEPGTAASLILNASGEKIPDFYDTSDGAEGRALNWLKTGEQVDPVSLADVV